MAYATTQEQDKKITKLLEKLPIFSNSVECDFWLNDNLDLDSIQLLCMFFECDISKLSRKIVLYK